MQLLGTGSQRAGKQSRIEVTGSATRIRAAAWDVEDQMDDNDTTNFESGGMGEALGGIEEARWSFRGLWDASRSPFADPPGVYPRDDLLLLKFYENTTDNVNWLFYVARVRSCRNGTEVRGNVTLESSGMSQGTYLRPSTNV